MGTTIGRGSCEVENASTVAVACRPGERDQGDDEPVGLHQADHVRNRSGPEPPCLAQGAGGLDRVCGLRLSAQTSCGMVKPGEVDRRQLHPLLEGVYQLPDLLYKGNRLGPLVCRCFAQAAEVRGGGVQPGVRSAPQQERSEGPRRTSARRPT